MTARTWRRRAWTVAGVAAAVLAVGGCTTLLDTGSLGDRGAEGDGGQDSTTGDGPGLTSMLAISPTSANFVTTTATMPGGSQRFDVANMGGGATAALTTDLSGANESEFSITADTCNGTTLPGGEVCSVTLQFDPHTYGLKSASLDVGGLGGVSAPLMGAGQDMVTLAVATAGSGIGTVTGDQIDCGSTCSESVTRTTSTPTVTLTATPGVSSTFAGWSGGGCSGSTPSCAVALNAATTVIATFTLIQVLSVKLRVIGGGATGSISSTPPGIQCSVWNGACSTYATFDVGTSVKLSLTGVSGSALTAWLPSSCFGTTCTVTMDADHSVSYTATENNIVFATSATYNGNLGGLAGATTICKNTASSVGFPGNYVPWLATTTVNATTALGSARGWIRPDGLPFADTVAGLTNGQVYYPPHVDEAGNPLGSNGVHVDVSTGSNPDGSFSSANGTDTCSDWTSDSNTVNGLVGTANGGSRAWVTSYSNTCDTLNSLYCFGTDLNAPVTVTPVAGRHAFVSKTSFAAASGVAAADAICKDEAAAAALPNAANFLALIASNGTTAQSRFNLTAANWVRIDGLALAIDIDNLFAGNVLVTPSQHADGTYLAQWTAAWTGAESPGSTGTMATTCNNWASNANGVTGLAGLPSIVSFSWFAGDTLPCTGTGISLYCFEN